MSSQYTTEPPATATVLLHTTAGPLTISLFAQQTPLTCRNFIQLCLDGYYDNNIFHRISPGFVIQTGDPTGTGEGGQSIYEDREFEKLDADWAKIMRTDEGEPIKFGDEIHSRLKFNRRGLVGMAKGTGEGGGYGSQFFITLGDCRPQLDGNCTMFGRIEGDGIYNVVKIAEAELIEGSERPMYPEKILRVEIIDMPKQDAWQKIKKRDRVAARTVEKSQSKKKPLKKKGGKALLSFGGEEGDEDTSVVRPKKAKFNTALIDSTAEANGRSGTNESTRTKTAINALQTGDSTSPIPPPKRKASPPQAAISPEPKRRKPSFHDSVTQLPIRNPESPSRSPTPDSPPARRRSSASKQKTASDLQSEINALKASMRRSDAPITDNSNKKKSALEALIPATSIRGRRRPRPGDTNEKDKTKGLSVLDAFKARLESASTTSSTTKRPTVVKKSTSNTQSPPADDEEAHLCDLHFIANCLSCFPLESTNPNTNQEILESETDDRSALLTHALTFAKDRLGKDLNWKKKNEEELVVIDPREREKELGLKGKKDRDKGKGKGREWDRDRDRESDTRRKVA